MIEGEEAWMPLYEAVEFVEAQQCCHRQRAIKLVREALEAGPLRVEASRVSLSGLSRRARMARKDTIRIAVSE